MVADPARVATTAAGECRLTTASAAGAPRPVTTTCSLPACALPASKDADRHNAAIQDASRTDPVFDAKPLPLLRCMRGRHRDTHPGYFNLTLADSRR